jgi:hypothetical protein
MKTYDKLEWIHCAIQEAQNGNLSELNEALAFVEELREPHLEPEEDDPVQAYLKRMAERGDDEAKSLLG